MPRIDRVRIHNFRGASSPFDINFAKNKKLVVIFGENGTGKTTIVDALDAVGNCSGGSLAMKSSTTLKDHLPTAGKKPSDMLVEVSAGSTTWQATLKRNEIVTTPTPRPVIQVLRRTNLQRFIDSQPAKRYDELRHLIGVERVERSEDALKRALDNVKQQLDDAVRTRTNAEEQLEQSWQAEGSPGSDATAWAEAEAAEDAAGLIALARRVRASREAIGAALRLRDEWDQAENALDQGRREATDIEDEVASLPGIDASGAMQLAAILERVRNHLASGEHGDRCPVCRQGIGAADLRTDLDARLGELARFETLSKRRQAADDRPRLAADAAAAKRAGLVRAARHLLTIADGTADGFAPIELPTAASAALSDAGTAPADAPALAAALVAACNPLIAPLLAREDAANRAAGRVNILRSLRSRMEETKTATIELDHLLSGLKTAHDLVRTTRIDFTQRILDDVADECGRLYAAIHPDEALEVSRIELDRQRRASLTQTVHFEGHRDVPPQAFFSEAHLDTLGFCFWLAFAKRESQDGDAVVVLDDIFSSVDAPHLTRIADLVVDESANFAQIIVTTHQRRWRDIYKYSYGTGNSTELVELQRWSLAKGISSHSSPFAVAELASAIDATPFDRLTVASRAGILLEATLLKLARLYRCSVPMKPENDYTLAELLDGTAGLFKRLELRTSATDGDGQSTVPPSFTTDRPQADHAALQTARSVRNQVGAHFNAHGADIADAEVAEFGRRTVQLVHALTCRTCGQLPSRSTGSHFKCPCPAPRAVQMSPLQLT